ncbi:MAG: TrkH family potassium uptake protein [Clostridia bacterium]|nr:TrkH family potassium uptake protein [Clostridia bacterium]
MNYKLALKILGYILLIEAGFMLIPLLISVFQAEAAAVRAFLVTIVITAAIGLPCSRLKPAKTAMQAREGFVIVGLAWVVLSVFGALPLYLSDAFPTYVDALFEIVSGFTTTGSTVLSEIESLSRGVLFWRSFSHWLGGMGVLVFLLSVVPLSGESIHLMRAESPGPSVEKFTPRLRTTAKRLYFIYIVLTLVQIVLLCLGGMPLFDSCVTAFGTAGTGGFAVKNASIAAYGSVYLETVIAIFMVLFGVNFSIYNLILLRRIRSVLKNEELRVYLGVILVAIALIVWDTVGTVYANFGVALRYAGFQVSSIITTTGYTSANYDLWPPLSRAILLILMFVGASAGSTGGGLKISRIMILWKAMRRQFRSLVHPNSISVVKLDGERLDEPIVQATLNYFFVYVLIFTVSVTLIFVCGHDLATSFSSVAACLNNVGPGMGPLVGAVGNYGFMGAFEKIVLSFNMLVGRLEIYPMLLLFSPSLWKRRGKRG